MVDKRYSVHFELFKEYDKVQVGLKDCTIIVVASNKFAAMAQAWEIIRAVCPTIDEPHTVTARTINVCD